VEVIEHEHDRAALSGVVQELGGRVEQAKSRGLRLDRGRWRQIRKALTQLREDLGKVGGTGPVPKAAGSLSRT
jgi:hypothetical protein